MQFTVKFDASDNFGTALGSLRKFLKVKAGILRIQLRRRKNHAVSISGEGADAALLLLSSHGYDLQS